MTLCTLRLNCCIPSPIFSCPNLKSKLPSNSKSSQLKLITFSKPTTIATKTTHGVPRWVLLGGASLGLSLLLLGFDGQHEALAFGPEGPLVEEFWDNMRRYGLYILTVSTGVVYTIFQPIVELLRNPITAVLIITVVVGSGYLVSQIVSAMVGISDFSYNYAY